MKISTYRNPNYYLEFLSGTVEIDLVLEITQTDRREGHETFEYKVLRSQLGESEVMSRWLVKFLATEQMNQVNEAILAALAAELTPELLYSYFYNGTTS